MLVVLLCISCSKNSLNPKELAMTSKLLTISIDNQNHIKCLDQEGARIYLNKIWPLYDEKRSEIEKIIIQNDEFIEFSKNFCDSSVKKFLDQ